MSLLNKPCTFQVTNRLTKVEHDLQEKEALVSRLQEAASRSQEDRRRLETQLEEKVKLVDKRENTIKKLSGEIIKANEIIAKLQVEKIKINNHKPQPKMLVILSSLFWPVIFHGPWEKGAHMAGIIQSQARRAELVFG